jgi:hypothetical protein
MFPMVRAPQSHKKYAIFGAAEQRAVQNVHFNDKLSTWINRK